MLFTVAVTQNALVNPNGQTVSPETVVVEPQAVTARDPNTAVLALGAANADKVLKADPQLLVVHIRQGV